MNSIRSSHVNIVEVLRLLPDDVPLNDVSEWSRWDVVNREH